MLIGCYSCNRNNEDLYSLPNETQIGANSFGFKLNGNIWNWNAKYFYNQSGSSRDNPNALYDSISRRLHISADRVIYRGLTTTSSASIDFTFLRNFRQPGTYRLSKIDSLYDFQYTDWKLNNYYSLIPNRETFEITITKFDTISNIVSGKFNGKLFNIFNALDSIDLSEGRFDIKLKTQ